MRLHKCFGFAFFKDGLISEGIFILLWTNPQKMVLFMYYPQLFNLNLAKMKKLRIVIWQIVLNLRRYINFGPTVKKIGLFTILKFQPKFKGQLISKCLFGAFNSSKNERKQFILVRSSIFVRFFEELKIPKRYFEI